MMLNGFRSVLSVSRTRDKTQKRCWVLDLWKAGLKRLRGARRPLCLSSLAGLLWLEAAVVEHERCTGERASSAPTAWQYETHLSHTKLTERLIDWLFRWPFDLPAGCVAATAVSRREAVIKLRYPPAGLITLNGVLLSNHTIWRWHYLASFLWTRPGCSQSTGFKKKSLWFEQQWEIYPLNFGAFIAASRTCN